MKTEILTPTSLPYIQVIMGLGLGLVVGSNARYDGPEPFLTPSILCIYIYSSSFTT